MRGGKQLIALGASLLGLLGAAPVALAQTPVPTTGAASQITSSGAVLNGTVLPGGTSSVSYRFAYGTSPTSLSQTTPLTAAGSGTTAKAVSATISGLSPSTTYYFQLIIRLSRTNFSGAVQSFTSAPPPQIPQVSTGAVTQLTPGGALLGGSLNPAGSQTVSYQFSYGTLASQLVNTTTPSPGISGTSATPVTAGLSGLTPGTTYYFRLDASLGGKTFSGTVQSFTTPQIPAVTTDEASQVTPSGAMAGGTINPSGPLATSYHFSYGNSPAILSQTTATVRGPSGTAGVSVSTALSNLAPDTTYYFRLDVTVGGQTFSGPVQSFTTTIPPPDPVSRSPSWITNTAATLGGLVNPTGFATTYRFDWGTTAAYGHTTPAVSAGAANNEIPVSFTIAGLAPNTTYHFRVVAQSAGGTVLGDDQEFTTGAQLIGPPQFALHMRPRVSIKAALGSGLAVKFSCSSQCTVHFAVILAPGTAREARLPMNLARRDVSLTSGGSGTATIRFAPGIRRRLRFRRLVKLAVSAYASAPQTRPTASKLTTFTLARK